MTAVDGGGVEFGEFLEEDVDGPAVGGDMVAVEEGDIIVIGELDEGSAEEGALGEVEGALGVFGGEAGLGGGGAGGCVGGAGRGRGR